MVKKNRIIIYWCQYAALTSMLLKNVQILEILTFNLNKLIQQNSVLSSKSRTNFK